MYASPHPRQVLCQVSVQCVLSNLTVEVSSPLPTAVSSRLKLYIISEVRDTHYTIIA